MRLISISAGVLALTLSAHSQVAPETDAAESVQTRTLSGLGSGNRAFVVGGRTVQISEWPTTVSIRGQHNITNDPITYCGGSIIHPDWIITAAHCVVHSEHDQIDMTSTHTPPKKGDDGLWRHEHFGVVEIVSGTDDLADETKMIVQKPSEIIVHPDYQPISFGQDPLNDIALIRIDDSDFFEVLPIAPENGLEPKPGESRGIVVGFGSTGSVSEPKSSR